MFNANFGGEIGAAVNRAARREAAQRRRAAWIEGWVAWVEWAAEEEAPAASRRCWVAGWRAAARANEMGGLRPIAAEAEGEWPNRHRR